VDLFSIPGVWDKLHSLEASVHGALLSPLGKLSMEVARDAEVRHVRAHPDKAPWTSREGQARLLHDLASIELQAMELGLRSLHEYPEAPAAFRRELAEIVLGEGRHLRLCLEGLESLGASWGQWPVHLALWLSVDPKDSLLDRILIVHRYLEGSGLDAGDSIFRRLSGVDSPLLRGVVKTIVDEEIGHVEFGSRYYREICRLEGLDAAEDFDPRMRALHYRLPRRMEPIARALREKAGFVPPELATLEALREIRYSAAGSA
jgi:uncharacterized ferritin-like protein (DUF455 family)